MFIRILDCIRIDHDPKLITLAVIVSVLSGFTIFAVLSHARAQRGSAQYGWSVMAACVAGGGIWSTHFIAMLGFSPASAVSYDITLTIISALLSIGIAGAAMPLLLSRASVNAMSGAVVLSTAIGAMHFTGMKALVFGGTLEWEPVLIALSLLSAVILVGAAIFIERLSISPRHRIVAAALFGAAICCLHFTAMAAAVIKSDPTIVVAEGGLSEFLLGLSVAFVTSSIVVLSLVTVFFDKRAQRASTDAEQIRSVIEAAQTGIVVCQNQRVVAANRTFGQLVNLNQEEIEGRPLANFIVACGLTGGHSNSCQRDVEAQLKTSAGARVDVALSATPILSGGAPRHLIEVRDIRAEKAAREHMIYLANHDALTGLPNLRLFRAELHRAVAVAAASCEEVGLLWLDLDHFKVVNDTYGHAVGDAFLCSVAARFRSALGERHLLARVGGDEFVVLCRPAEESGDPAAVALRLLAATAEPITINDKGFDVALSIGLAVYPHDADTPDTLMHKADAALYEVKRTGRGRWSRAA
jgi:diguanylate cyclase (GGDEF)-like protein/PAS domain S-box-containing protein